MSTEFSFEHVFRAPSPEAVIAAYFDPEHNAAQDKIAQLEDRQVLESHDDSDKKKVTWRVVSQKPLPVYVRPFVKGGKLAFLETMTWNKATNSIDLTVAPDILNGRVQIAAKYQLTQAGEGQVKRKYSGSITANITLLSGKIERGIRDEFQEGIPAMQQCTQTWLDSKRT